MTIPIKTDMNITVEDIDVNETSFKSLNLKESHIEEFISGLRWKSDTQF